MPRSERTMVTSPQVGVRDVRHVSAGTNEWRKSHPPPRLDQRRVSTISSPCWRTLIGKPCASSRTKASVLDQRKLPPTRMAPTLASPITILRALRSEEPTSELQSLMRTSYAVFCLKKKK